MAALACDAGEALTESGPRRRGRRAGLTLATLPNTSSDRSLLAQLTILQLHCQTTYLLYTTYMHPPPASLDVPCCKHHPGCSHGQTGWTGHCLTTQKNRFVPDVLPIPPGPVCHLHVSPIPIPHPPSPVPLAVISSLVTRSVGSSHRLPGVVWRSWLTSRRRQIHFQGIYQGSPLVRPVSSRACARSSVSTTCGSGSTYHWDDQIHSITQSHYSAWYPPSVYPRLVISVSLWMTAVPWLSHNAVIAVAAVQCHCSYWLSPRQAVLVASPTPFGRLSSNQPTDCREASLEPPSSQGLGIRSRLIWPCPSASGLLLLPPSSLAIPTTQEQHRLHLPFLLWSGPV